MASATAEAKGTEAKPDGGGEAAKAPAASGGGIKAFLPLLIAVVVMPALAYVTTNFVLLPKIKSALTKSAPAAAETPADSGAKETKDGAKTGSPKVTVPLTKVLVNVAGTMGTRYLMTSFTLVGKNADFKAKIEENKDQLLDLAQSTLRSKTIADLEKPGSQNVIRNELLTVFNNALGGPVVQEIYITEMAIQ